MPRKPKPKGDSPPDGGVYPQSKDDGRQSLFDASVNRPTRSLQEILDTLPTAPGVYIMKDRKAAFVYIGKAGNLRNRVRQYFQPSTSDIRDFVPLLGGIVADIETIVTGNEKEALLLENTLIKQHQPRFNINLRDDKSYLVLRLDPKADWPRLEVGRKMKEDGAWYFGPYHSASSARQALRVVNRHFQLRTCTDHVLRSRSRPCLQYQIKRCPAPCVLDVPKAEYSEQVRDVRLFLDGKSDELLDNLKDRMDDAAQAMQYERAAAIRDQLRALQSSLQDQNVVSRAFEDQDAIGFYRQGLALEVAVVSIRDGKMVGTRNFAFGVQEFPDAEILSTFVGLYYDLNPNPPAEVLLPFSIPDEKIKSDWLGDLRKGNRGRKVALFAPQRGTKTDIVDLANKNAKASFESRRNNEKDQEEMLAGLQKRLKLSVLPRVIECYDISHVQGTETVASMVVFVDGQPDKSRYRRFKLQNRARPQGGYMPDDFASMYEVLSRRLRRARDESAKVDGKSTDSEETKPGWKLPDLIVIDGGKGQLGSALAAARDIGIDTRWGQGLAMVGLAKERDNAQNNRNPDRVFLPHAKDGIAIRPNTGEMFVLQRLRDEAHRFAVTFHRSQRSGRTLQSELGQIAGIGKTRQTQLLRHFGSVRKIRDASLDSITAVDGITAAAARSVYTHFHGSHDPSSSSPIADAAELEDEALDNAFVEIEAGQDDGQD